MPILITAYQNAFQAHHNKQAPEVRKTCDGGYYIKSPVRRQFTASDMRKITRFHERSTTKEDA